MFQNQLHLSFKRIDIWIWVFKINVKIDNMVGQQTTSVHLDVHPFEEEEYLGVHEQHGGTTDNVHLDVHPFEEEEGSNSLTLLQLEDLVEQFHSVELTSSLFL